MLQSSEVSDHQPPLHSQGHVRWKIVDFFPENTILNLWKQQEKKDIYSAYEIYNSYYVRM